MEKAFHDYHKSIDLPEKKKCYTDNFVAIMITLSRVPKIFQLKSFVAQVFEWKRLWMWYQKMGISESSTSKQSKFVGYVNPCL